MRVRLGSQSASRGDSPLSVFVGDVKHSRFGSVPDQPVLYKTRLSQRKSISWKPLDGPSVARKRKRGARLAWLHIFHHTTNLEGLIRS
jgi:hypothetical protein